MWKNRRNKQYEDIGGSFVEELVFKSKAIRNECILEMKEHVELKLPIEDETNHRNAKPCSICNEEFDKRLKATHKVKDHCHRTGAYRGAAHSTCYKH